MNINENNPFKDVSGIKAKKKLLIAMSIGAKQVAKMKGETVNEVLIASYMDKNHQAFKTFKDWEAEGMMVKKGAKAFCVWSKPIEVVKESEDENEAAEEFEYYGIAHVFSNYQIKKIGGKNG